MAGRPVRVPATGQGLAAGKLNETACARSAPALLKSAFAACLATAALAACSEIVPAPGACTVAGRPLNMGFYAYYKPISYAAGDAPGASDFNVHLGYEADLLTAMEAMDGARLSFSRRAIPDWPGIWLLSAGDDYDLVGGGITILETRTRDDQGRRAVSFTRGHVAFRQSLLVRAADAARLNSYSALTRDARVGVLAGTTGEARLLQLVGLADADGVLAAGTRIETPAGTVEADGTSAFVVTAAMASPVLDGRTLLHPPSDDRPQVVYLGYDRGEAELLEGLRDGVVDAVARGEIGNADAAGQSEGAFVVTARDAEAEYGGFTVDAEDAALLACLNEKIDWLTDERTVGYAEWRADPSVFLKRAKAWRPAS